MKELVRLRAAGTGEILVEAPAVRNERPEINWESDQVRRPRGYIEATDSDTPPLTLDRFWAIRPTGRQVPASPHRPLRLRSNCRQPETHRVVSKIAQNPDHPAGGCAKSVCRR